MGLNWKFNEEKSAIGRILAENVAVSWSFRIYPGDDGDKSSLLDCPDGVFAGRATPEISSCDEDGSTGSARLIKEKILLLLAGVREGEFTVTRFGDHCEESGRDDPVGIDVVLQIDCDFPGSNGESGHVLIMTEF